MALHDPVVTLESVVLSMVDRYSITLRLVIPDNDATAPGINQTFTLQLKQGVGVGNNNNAFKTVMNECITKYQREQTLRNNANWGTAITAIKNGLVI